MNSILIFLIFLCSKLAKTCENLRKLAKTCEIETWMIQSSSMIILNHLKSVGMSWNQLKSY
jgi:hypothetical protein